MFQVLRHRAYRHLFGAQIVSLMGTGLATVALGLLAYDLAGDQASTILGTVFAIKMVAYVIVAPLTSAAVAKQPRRRVLVIADLLRVGVALALPLAMNVWQVFILILVLQAASATFTPTFQSVIPLVLTDECDYTNALSLSRLAYDIESIASPMVAAALLIIMPANALFIGTAAGFLASACLVLAAALPKGIGLETDMNKPDLPFGGRARQGITVFFSNPALRPLLALDAVVASTGALVIVQTVVIARSHFGLSETAVAILLGCSGAGSMLSALLLPRWLDGWGERRTMIGGSLLATMCTAIAGIVLGLPGTTLGVMMIGLLWFVHGLGWSSIQTPVGRILRRESTNTQLAPVFAARFSLSHAAWLVAYPLCGWLGSFGLMPAALTLAALAMIGTLVAMMLWPSAALPCPDADVLLELEEPVAMTPNDSELDYAASVLRLMADRTRLAILAMLDEEELSVSAIAERLNRPLPAISQHLAKLRTAGLVQVRKDGTTSFYSQSDEHLNQLVTNALHYSEHYFNPNPLHHRAQT
ncbi:metalloregulator ArsR/SmtB family transcription factor [Stomatohabitans albus]|uniref:metalloregulator ArsR/SmtB family transcription factor n=1 Tax=Stomatohabitans albus TaxID=3110766 RepID=UPI00300CE2AF